MELSVVIPAYNEALRLPATLDRICTYLQQRGQTYEVLVVDDGSRDTTAEVAGGFAARGVVVLRQGVNRGKGAAVRAGMQASRGARVLLCDADLSTPIEELERLAARLAEAPLVLGSRAVTDARISRRQPFYRELMGKTFNLVIRLLGITGIHDTQCGFKLLDGQLARELAAQLTVERFAYDVELIWLAQLRGCRVLEVGVAWHNSPASTVHPVIDSASMLCDVVRMRWRHRRHRGQGAVTLLLALALAAGGCGAPVPAGFSLDALVHDGRYTVGAGEGPGLRLRELPQVVPFTAAEELRPAVVLPAGSWTWRGMVPPGAWLQVGAARAQATSAGPLALSVTAVRGDHREVLEVAREPATAAPEWLDLGLDLSRFAGQELTLELAGRLGAGEANAGDGTIAWGHVALTGPVASRGDAPPNLLLIVIDTLRFDRLSCYGYHRPTTPHIDRLLAERGVLVEQAYAQAPWTLPSVASFMTGRYPGEILGEAMSSFAIPETAVPMAEVLAGHGYQTAGFNANPALFPGNGFARGFRSFFSPPRSLEWFSRHADEVNRRALGWLRAYQHRRPFFLYLQYLDPHDPYDNPDIVNGRSPYAPDYSGHLSGRDIHGIYAGAHPLQNPEQDVAHISALYDSEVHFVDRYVGQLLAAIDPEVLADTLVVLTSDHGEELYDHGGWKHGQTLYEEQIHVPLLLRWDRRLPAGRRLAGPVQLLDLLPTLAAAAGIPAEPGWQGIDLLPALAGEQPLPRRAAFAQHMSAGPLRAAAVLDDRKLILFNRRTPFSPPDPLQGYLWHKDLARMADLELYDLAADPGERHNLGAGQPAAAAALAPAVHRQLNRQLAGLRLVPAGLPPGSRLRGELRFDQPPESWNAYFLAPGDQIEIRGSSLLFELGGSAVVPDRGVLIQGEFERLESVSAELDGRPLPAKSVLLAGGVPYPQAPVPRTQLRTDGWPVDASGSTPRLHLWLPEQRAAVQAEENPETRLRLIALGYAQ